MQRVKSPCNRNLFALALVVTITCATSREIMLCDRIFSHEQHSALEPRQASAVIFVLLVCQASVDACVCIARTGARLGRSAEDQRRVMATGDSNANRQTAEYGRVGEGGAWTNSDGGRRQRHSKAVPNTSRQLFLSVLPV